MLPSRANHWPRSHPGRDFEIAPLAEMKIPENPTVKLEIASRIEMVEVVQAVVSHLCTSLGVEGDRAHYVNVAVRESVVNAVKHGNKLDENKRVTVWFCCEPDRIEVSVLDQGQGFDPDSVPNPVAEENLLKAYGRGIFFMRSFMDEIEYEFPSGGGTMVRMVKHLPKESEARQSSAGR